MAYKMNGKTSNGTFTKFRKKVKDFIPKDKDIIKKVKTLVFGKTAYKQGGITKGIKNVIKTVKESSKSMTKTVTPKYGKITGYMKKTGKSKSSSMTKDIKPITLLERRKRKLESQKKFRK